MAYLRAPECVEKKLLEDAEFKSPYETELYVGSGVLTPNWQLNSATNGVLKRELRLKFDLEDLKKDGKTNLTVQINDGAPLHHKTLSICK